VELRRVLQVARAYRYGEEADAAVGQGRYEDAAAAYQLVMALAPEIAELKAWATIALVQMGQEREAMTLFETAYRADPGLVELLPRVAALGLVQADPTLLEQIATLVPRRVAPSWR
jgi:tetratricopeptide (TPR) repeat protein